MSMNGEMQIFSWNITICKNYYFKIVYAWIGGAFIIDGSPAVGPNKNSHFPWTTLIHKAVELIFMRFIQKIIILLYPDFEQ